jgi:hypothetical protein
MLLAKLQQVRGGDTNPANDDASLAHSNSTTAHFMSSIVQVILW